MSAGSPSFAKLVIMSSAAPTKSAGNARYASQDTFIQSLLSHTISTPIFIKSAFFLRRTQLIDFQFRSLGLLEETHFTVIVNLNGFAKGSLELTIIFLV